MKTIMKSIKAAIQLFKEGLQIISDNDNPPIYVCTSYNVHMNCGHHYCWHDKNLNNNKGIVGDDIGIN